ncbi:MAG: GFA family protein [Verrucomicrobia bacterium]|nr:GFA family protein [Verrucomicrobiota bacterium]
MKKPQAKRVSASSYTGACLCGGIRFTFHAEPDWPHYCCCDDCQKWSGAPAVAWVDFPQSAFHIDDEKAYLRRFKSSPIAHRAFCSNCGTSLFAIDDDGRNMSVTITSLDRPNLHRPESVSYTSFAARWFPHKELIQK